jgi:two-component system sensor histidine kinase KdpD
LTHVHPLPRLLYPCLRSIGVLAAIAAVTAMDFKLLHVNSPTAAFSFLLLILGIAARYGLMESIIASVASVLAYNFFFLPPIGTLTIADPQNWVALFAFLATAITASQLSTSARRKAEEAALREQEVKRLYEFSRALMLSNKEQSLCDQIVQKLAELFGVQQVSFYDLETDTICKLDHAASLLPDAALREVAMRTEIYKRPDAAVLIAPIRLGGRSLGSIGIAGNKQISEVALQAIAQLIAIALERARAEEVATRNEAARQNEQLKSTMLDALAHEFKTPLTSIKAAATTLLSRQGLSEPAKDLLTVVDEEVDRLTNLVSEAIEIARIGAGPVRLHREPYSAEKLISAVSAQLRHLAEDRLLEVKIEQHLPAMEIDPKLCELALRQVLHNAIKYSPPASPIRITAENQMDAIVIRVANAGPAIPKAEQALIFEKFYRGREVRTRVSGAGMGLAIAREIVEAHGGRIWVKSGPEAGVEFSLAFPNIAFRPQTGEGLPTVA